MNNKVNAYQNNILYITVWHLITEECASLHQQSHELCIPAITTEGHLSNKTIVNTAVNVGFHKVPGLHAQS